MISSLMSRVLASSGFTALSWPPMLTDVRSNGMPSNALKNEFGQDEFGLSEEIEVTDVARQFEIGPAGIPTSEWRAKGGDLGIESVRRKRYGDLSGLRRHRVL